MTSEHAITSESTDAQETSMPKAEIFGMKPDTYCMLLHLSQLLNLLSACVPLLGVAVPIVLWAIAKDRSPQVNQHGKIILNWQISLFLYAAISIAIAIACFVGTVLVSIVIGFPLFLPIGMLFLGFILFLLGILMLVFPLIGAIRANEGVAWKYPLGIPFFKSEAV